MLCAKADGRSCGSALRVVLTGSAETAGKLLFDGESMASAFGCEESTSGIETLCAGVAVVRCRGSTCEGAIAGIGDVFGEATGRNGTSMVEFRSVVSPDGPTCTAGALVHAAVELAVNNFCGAEAGVPAFVADSSCCRPAALPAGGAGMRTGNSLAGAWFEVDPFSLAVTETDA
jgi:hypothetical protein